VSKSAHPRSYHFDVNGKNGHSRRPASARAIAYDAGLSPRASAETTFGRLEMPVRTENRAVVYEDNIEVKKIPLSVTLAGVGLFCGGFWALVALAVVHG